MMETPVKTLTKFARLLCSECAEEGLNAEKFITAQEYERQLKQPDIGWRCPDCKCYPCAFDEEYFERQVQIVETVHPDDILDERDKLRDLDFEAISNTIKNYGPNAETPLFVEIFYFAMSKLKEDPETTITEALEYGIGEWDK